MSAGVRIHPLCVAELQDLGRRDIAEHRAMLRALHRLGELGDNLGHPHTSAVRSPTGRGLRELRPRRGRSQWRVLYRPGRPPAALALAPEAQRDPRGFRRAVESARARDRDLRGDHAR